jgi:general secretion pathway protein I
MAERRSSSQAGMTLLEIMVALVILAFGLAVLFDAVGLGTGMAGVADQRRAATAAAQSLLAELGRSRPIADGATAGDFPDGQSWRLDITPVASAADVPGPLQGHQVELTVSWPDAAGTRSLVFDTLLLTAAP